MEGKNKIWAMLLFLVILVTGIFWFKPDQTLHEGMIINTAVPSEIDLSNEDNGIDGRYISQAQIIAFDPQESSADPVLLTEDFYSARSPEVSYDGRRLLFAGQKTAGELWQIYIKDLITYEVVQVTHCPVNCTDPAWLPDGRILFSRLDEMEPAGQVHVLYACHADGCCMERLTFHPESAIASSVTNDGRIITLSARQYSDLGERQYLALRTDGTKSELFYKGDNKNFPVSRCWEGNDGRIYFIENGMQADQVMSIDFGHPLSSRKLVLKSKKRTFHSIYPFSEDQLLVSARLDDEAEFGLYLVDSQTGEIKDQVKSSDRYHLIEPVLTRNRQTPLKLPAIVDMTKGKGTFLCHDSGLSTIAINNEDKDKETYKVQVYGLDEMLGEVPVEEDGSFYVEVDADIPVRFQTVNAAGEVLRGPSAWVWVRPNERRSCIGCHEDRELAPENRVPDALYSGMVSLPEGLRTEPVVLSDKSK